MKKFAVHHPYMVVLLVLCCACLVFGPATVGSWLAVHGRQVIVGAYHFVRAFVSSAV